MAIWSRDRKPTNYQALEAVGHSTKKEVPNFRDLFITLITYRKPILIYLV